MNQENNKQKNEKTAITPTRAQDYPEWYQQVIKAAELADNSPVRGCMVIKPWGYALWENIQKDLDRRFKDTGHVNAYFPLFIPVSFLEQEAKHVEGFAKECAVVTHHRLEQGEDGHLKPAGELEEAYVVRPTSETIIGAMYAKWVQSYRDLPILINQWANVVRWEMRTRMFLRTTEFLWQEGHTCHATAEEAREETRKMLDVYTDFARDFLAIPVIRGEKPPHERFPGAVNTYSIEAMMQDGKALQAGTSHFLGQNFSRAQEIKFSDAQGSEQFAWTTSWGVSTRLIGGLIMTHSDDDGLVLPPRVAPHHVVVIPIYKTEEEKSAVLEQCDRIKRELSNSYFEGKGIKTSIHVHVDTRDMRGGDKNWNHIKKGVPIRVEIGPRDLANQSLMMSRRDKGPKEKESLTVDNFISKCPEILLDIQNKLFERALSFRNKHTLTVNTLEELTKIFSTKETFEQISPFVVARCESSSIDEAYLKSLKLTARCIPIDSGFEVTSPNCIFTSKPCSEVVIFARAY